MYVEIVNASVGLLSVSVKGSNNLSAEMFACMQIHSSLQTLLLLGKTDKLTALQFS